MRLGYPDPIPPPLPVPPHLFGTRAAVFHLWLVPATPRHAAAPVLRAASGGPAVSDTILPWQSWLKAVALEDAFLF